MEATRQMPNLQAGFKNNIGPAQPHFQPNPQPALMQQIPQYQQVQMVPALMPQVGGDVDDGTINVIGIPFQRKYFYIFVGIILLIVAYYLWKWYSGGSKRKYNDDDEDEEFDPNMFMGGDPQQLMMNQMLQQQMLQQQMQAQRKGSPQGKQDDDQEPEE